MRFDVAHELGLAGVGTLAVLVVLLGGELSPMAWTLLLAPWVSAVLRLRGRATPPLSGTLLAFAALGLGLATLAQRGLEAAVLAAGYALSGILAARLLTRTTYAHDLQAIVVSLLLVMAGSVLNVSLSYGPLFVLYAVSVVWALTTRQLLASVERAVGALDPHRLDAMRARRDVVTPAFLVVTAAVAVSVLFSTGIVFVAFPRLGFGNLGVLAGKQGRFPSSVSLRGAPRAAAGSSEVIARVRGVRYDAFERGLYLRGAVYDEVTQQGFSQRQPPPAVAVSRLELAPAPEEGTYDVALSPVAGHILFSLGPARSVVPVGGGRANPNLRTLVAGTSLRGELLATAPLDGVFRYRVHGGVSAPGLLPTMRRPELALDDDEAAELLAVPADLDPRIRVLADDVVAAATEATDKAERLRRFLLQDFRYTLSQPNGDKREPLVAFLLEERQGHCEYFASAYALLLRLEGIPARVVGGYQGGAWDDSEDVVVFLDNNAHAWVEWFLPGAGWIVDDPTPLATAPRASLGGVAALLERVRRFWDDRVLDYALSDQRALLDKLRGGLSTGDVKERGAVVLAVLAALGALGVVAAMLKRRRGSKRRGGAQHPVGRALVAALERCRTGGLEPEWTLREALSRLPAAEVSEAERRTLTQLLDAYEADRFGGVPMGVGRIAEAVQLLRAIPSRTSSEAGAGAPTPL